MEKINAVGLDWDYDRRRGYSTEIEEFTLRVQSTTINHKGRQQWDWLVGVDGIDLAGENGVPFRDEAMGAALDFVRRMCIRESIPKRY